MPAPKSRQGGPGSAGASLKHLNPTVAERKVKFEVSVARHALLAASPPRRALGTIPHAARCGDFDQARPLCSPTARSDEASPPMSSRPPHWF